MHHAVPSQGGTPHTMGQRFTRREAKIPRRRETSLADNVQPIRETRRPHRNHVPAAKLSTHLVF